jgi:hypothetical protein
MKLPSDLTRRELIDLVTQLQEILFLQPTGDINNEWDPDKDWDCATLGCISSLADEFDLRPEERSPADCAACGKARVRPGVLFCSSCSAQAGT